jgi:hypothetical protein
MEAAAEAVEPGNAQDEASKEAEAMAVLEEALEIAQRLKTLEGGSWRSAGPGSWRSGPQAKRPKICDTKATLDGEEDEGEEDEGEEEGEEEVGEEEEWGEEEEEEKDEDEDEY